MPYVLIVSSLSERYYYDAFVRECRKRGVNVVILDPEHFTRQNHILDVRLDTGEPRGSLEVVELGDDANATILIDISHINVAWYLRVNRTFRISEIEDAACRFRWSETLWSLDSLFHALSCPWINTFETIERLNCNKLLQQMYAARVGLKTPCTVLSNLPATVTSFCEKCGGRLLLKTIGYTKLDPDGEYVIYSELFDKDELRQETDAIRVCPVYAQEYIPKRYEYRVMVIGTEVHACRIDSQASKKTEVDWRHYDFENVAHEGVTLPEYVSLKLLDFMRTAGLEYGAIDMIETPDGEYVFLEVNPSGQWDWIAKLGELPVAESVARMLRRYVS